MAEHSTIEWTNATWTPIRARLKEKIGAKAKGAIGWHCERVTTGCGTPTEGGCYAEAINKRLGTGLPFKPGHRADIELFLDEHMLLAPLRWKRPRMIFVCSMTDAFADFVTDDMLDKMFAVMGRAQHHTFQVLTKRADRMRTWADKAMVDHQLCSGGGCNYCGDFDGRVPWKSYPFPNVWLGVSAEHQPEADERIPHLQRTPAAVRFVSLEPLLGPIDFRVPFLSGDPRHKCDALTGQALLYGEGVNGHPDITVRIDKPTSAKLDWVIAGGESGPKARPMHPAWARSLRDQCAAADVPFFFKQWGAWAPMSDNLCGAPAEPPYMGHVGKKAAGRHLDGVEHNGMPEVAT